MIELLVKIAIALISGAIVADLASWFWLDWFNPATYVIFVGVTAMTLFVLSRSEVKDPEWERHLRRKDEYGLR